jgi:hypothetical protein
VELDPVGGDGPAPKKATFIQALYLPKNSQGWVYYKGKALPFLRVGRVISDKFELTVE